MRLLSLLALGAPLLVSAVQFNNPAANSTLTRGSNFDLQWSAVDTDPTAFSVYLVNFVNWPPYYEPLALDLETTTGEASVRIPCDVDSSYGYQFNAINGTNVYIIYAQTSKFFISGDACVDPVTTTAPASSCAAAPTVTQIVTVRGNSTLLASTAVAAAAPATTEAPGKALVAKAQSQGTCPATIGWSKDYSHPVTLTETPRADRTVATAAGYATATTTLAKPLTLMTTASASSGSGSGAETVLTALKQETKAKGQGGSKCGAKKMRKRHSDSGRVSPWKKARRAGSL
ncbi:hypothetical protein VMCG_09752 [Cytospora schulzeri]|uniref:Yeast cell wall synthesis Kre9/Knh1-like N-terminal domain-containing protein n=1 Tax=Cytospora schulzeri TaxID=448051 RepID=A0A423VH67_9PEZI|nr:hypothetical protein VMCG_09752 [Valsa malicola]